MNKLQTSNTVLVVDDKGLIQGDPDDLMHMEYSEECEMEIKYDEVRSLAKEFGYGSHQHISARVKLSESMQEFHKKRFGLTPRMFFTHVKASMNEIEVANLQERLRHIKKLAEYSRVVGQEGAKEVYMRMMLGAVRESEIHSIGFNFWVDRNSIDGFIAYVRSAGWDERKKRPIKKDRVVFLKDLKDFPRVVPKEVLTKLKEVRAKKVFDDYEVLYIDYANNNTTSATTKETNIAKDPILFGTIKELPNRLYFIHAWDDEHCDLNLEELVNCVEEGDYSFIPDAGEVDTRYLKKIKREVAYLDEKANGRFLVHKSKSLTGKIKSLFKKG